MPCRAKQQSVYKPGIRDYCAVGNDVKLLLASCVTLIIPSGMPLVFT